MQGAKSLFGLLFKELMEGLEAPEDGNRLVILIDALDECEHGDKNAMLDCISEDFPSLPSWLGVFITTRPEVKIWEELKSFNPSVIVPESEKNMADLRIFFAHALDGMLRARRSAEKHVNPCRKVWRYFHLCKYGGASEVRERRMDAGKDPGLPAGLDDFYEEQFRASAVKCEKARRSSSRR